MRNVSHKIVEQIKTHILYSITFPRKSTLLWYVAEQGEVGQATGDNVTRRVGFACWIPKATNTHSVYEIFIAFPLQQWLR